MYVLYKAFVDYRHIDFKNITWAVFLLTLIKNKHFE